MKKTLLEQYSFLIILKYLIISSVLLFIFSFSQIIANDLDYIKGDRISQKIENSSAGITFIPKGNYLIDYPIVLKGKSFLNIKAEPGTRIVSRDLYDDVFIIEECENIELENLHFTHYNPLDNYDCNGGEIRIVDSKSISIKNCELDGSGSTGITINRSENIEIVNSYIHNNTFTGIYASETKNLKIISNIFENNAQSFQFTTVSDVYFNNNLIKNNGGYWGGDPQFEPGLIHDGESSGLLSTFKDSTSYALGADLGTNLKQQKVEIDFDFFMSGLFDGMETDVVLLDKNQRREMVVALQKFVREKANEAENINLKAAEEFLENNKAGNSDVKETPTGLQYKVLLEGDGESPRKTDKVKVHYAGHLINGSEFDSSIKNGEPSSFGLNDVIKGWTEGLQLMKVGSKFEFYIHPNLGYGARGRAPHIPPNGLLIFEIELLEINPNEDSQLK
jgi:FKBP-type peptidyl-prolyl cis-trans isomerase FklB